MTAPQQIFIDERNDAAYVVEYAPSGKLWSVNLASGAKTTVLSNLENAVGMTLSADRSREPSPGICMPPAPGRTCTGRSVPDRLCEP